MDITKVLLLSDFHCGATNAIAAKKISLSEPGSWYTPSEWQLAINSILRECFQKASEILKGEKFCIIFNGDIVEGRHHKNEDALYPIPIQAIVFSDVINQIFEFVKVEQLHKTWFIKGTQAHAGIGNEFERFIADTYKTDLKIQKDGFKYVWDELYYEFPNDALMQVEHHFNQTAIYEQTGLEREWKEFVVDFAKSGRRPADIYYRAHVHRAGIWQLYSHPRTKLGVVVTPGWQGKSEYVKKKMGGRLKPNIQMGMYLLDIVEDKVMAHDLIRTILPDRKIQRP